MRKDRRIKDWNRVYQSQNDPELIAKAKRELQKEERLKEKKQDSGL